MNATTYDPFSSEVREDPYPIYRALRAEAPVYHNEEHDIWVLTRFDDVQAGARDWKALSSAEGTGLDRSEMQLFGSGEEGNFTITDPPVHTALRGMVRKLFAPKIIKETYTPPIQAETGRLLDEMERSESPDVIVDFARKMPAAIVTSWLGFPRADIDRVADLSVRALSREVGNPAMPESAYPALEELKEYIEALISHRRSEPSEDVVSWVIQAANEEGFDRRRADEYARNVAVFFYAAGTETTTALIGNALLALDRNPDQREILLGNPDLMPRAIEEFLRYDPSLQHVMRTTTEECEIRGVTIPEGSRAMLLFGSANRDEDRWERSEELDLTREPLRHLAFGEGIHHCLGAPLARLEGPIGLSAFLKRWPDYEVSGPIERLPGFSVRGLDRLPVSL